MNEPFPIIILRQTGGSSLLSHEKQSHSPSWYSDPRSEQKGGEEADEPPSCFHTHHIAFKEVTDDTQWKRKIKGSESNISFMKARQRGHTQNKKQTTKTDFSCQYFLFSPLPSWCTNSLIVVILFWSRMTLFLATLNKSISDVLGTMQFWSCEINTEVGHHQKMSKFHHPKESPAISF